MSKKLIYLISFVLLLGVLQAVPAEAKSIVFEFGGIVTDVEPGLDPPWDQVDVNDQWSIVYTFDPTTMDSTPSATRGDYYLTITSYTLTIGSAINSNSNPSGVVGTRIAVFDNRPPAWDQYEVSISGPGGQYNWFMQLDGPNTIWDTDELPLCGDIELSDFSTRDFRLTGWDPFGDGEINGSVDYHRCTPLEAHNPSPANGATCVGRDVVLSWSPGAYAAAHHVYFGVDQGALAFVGIKMLGDESYAPGLLELGTTYYWRINESDGTDIWVGDVWSFTVGYGTSTWTDSGGDALWCTPENWNPEGLPGPCDEAIIDLSDSPCVVDCNATCYKLTVGLDNGPCLLNMNSGTISVATDFIVGENAGSEGTVTLSGGVINTHSFGMRSSGGTGTMDMTSGTLLIDGNEISTINGYVGNGWITAYGGTGTVLALHNAATDKTLVTAVPAPGDGPQWVYFPCVPNVPYPDLDPPPPPPPLPEPNVEIFGTVNCRELQPPLEIEHLIIGLQYTGPIIPGINDLLIISRGVWVYNHGWHHTGISCKIAVPDWTNVPLPMPHWELPELKPWVELYVAEHISLPTVCDPNGDIPDIYVVANPAVWQMTPGTLQDTYEIVNGECDDLPGYLIGTTPIVFDRNAGPEENPFSTTRLTCTLYRNGEISLIPHSLPAPAPPGNPTPAQGATNVSTTADLSWTAGAGATSHNVYFGTSSPGTFRGNQLGLTFDPGTMEYGTRYYWRIDEIVPGVTTTGEVWSFDTWSADDFASNPIPADGATSVDPNVVLGWSPGDSAAEHNVYFGLDPGALALVATKPLGQESYEPSGLELNTTYYWRIDEVNGTNVWEGVVWSFTTRGLLFGDVELKPLGQAQLAIVDSNLVVYNIGSSGEDGVQCTKRGGLGEFTFVTVEFEDLNSAPVGTMVELTQKGTIGIGSEDTEQQLTALVVTKAASDEWTVTPDLTPVDVNSYQYQVFNDVNFAGVLPGGTGSTITMPTGPIEIGGGSDPPPQQYNGNPCGCGSIYIQGVKRHKLAWWKKSGTNTMVCDCPKPPPGPWISYWWDWVKCCDDYFMWKIDMSHAVICVDPEFLERFGSRIDVVGLENPSDSMLFGLDITAANTPSITITGIRATFPGCKWIIEGDIDGNCRVDFKDFAIMADNWLDDRTTWEP